MGDSAKEGHHEIHTRVHFKAMKYRVQESLIYGLLAAAFLFCCTRPALGIVVHPNEGEPNLIEWTDRPDPNVVGRWSSNASFVVVAPNWIITTRHQSTSPTIVTIEGITYDCHYNSEWVGGSGGNADIQLIRLTTTDGGNPNLAHYASPYEGSDEKGQDVVIGGYGDGRGGLLKTRGTTYGYEWDNSSNTTLRLGTNKVDDTKNNNTLGSLTSDIIIADFDGLNEGESTVYECIPAVHDSGGGWFIHDGNEWKVAGLSRAVDTHYEQGHFDDPNYILYEAWFRNKTNPNTLQPDYLDAVRINSYAAWIHDIIYVPGDLTGDDWVDFTDFGAFANQWGRDDCSELNNWCEGADFEPTNGSVDWDDLAFLADVWLTGWEY